MNKVLIVDDESIIREGLRSFPWKRYGCRLVGEAEDGEEGLLLAEVLQPDIVVCDIKMPGMDGITLAQKLQESHPDTGIILLTGYEEFSYAKAAMQAGIRDYILKPTDSDALGASLCRLGALLETRKEKRLYYEKMERQMVRMQPFLQARLVDDLLDGRYLSEEAAKETMALYDIEEGTYLIVSVLASPGEAGELAAPKDRQLFFLAIENICHEIFSHSARDAIGSGPSGKMAYLLVFGQNSSPKNSVLAVCRACEKAQQAVKRFLNASISFGISRLARQLMDLREAGEQARTALDHGFFVGKDSIVSFDDLNLHTQEEWILPGQSDHVRSLVQAGDESGIQRFFDELRLLLSNKAGGNIQQMKSQIILLTLYAVHSTMGISTSPDNTEELLFLQKALGCSTKHQLLELSFQEISRAARQNREGNSSRCDDIGMQMEQYIRAHYAEDLSLDLLAEHFYLSTAYISRLLKKRTGRGFLEILTDIRMEQAKWLLSSGTYRVHQVAEMVGYRDFSYFIQVFRKRHGMTPNDYKTLHLG